MSPGPGFLEAFFLSEAARPPPPQSSLRFASELGGRPPPPQETGWEDPGCRELPRCGSNSCSAPLTSQAWRPRLPSNPRQSKPSRDRLREKSSCSFKNIRVQQTRALHRRARAGWAGFVNGAASGGGGERGGEGVEGRVHLGPRSRGAQIRTPAAQGLPLPGI